LGKYLTHVNLLYLYWKRGPSWAIGMSSGFTSTSSQGPLLLHTLNNKILKASHNKIAFVIKRCKKEISAEP